MGNFNKIMNNNVTKKSLIIIIPKLIGGGAETFVKNFSSFLLKEKQEFKIHIYTAETNKSVIKQYVNDGISIVTVNNFLNFLNMFKLYKYIRENEITYMMSFLWKSDFIGAFMKLLIGKKIKLFISERGDRLIRNKLHQKAYKIKNCIDKFFIFKYSDYLVTNSIKTKYFLYKMGLDTKKFVYLPNLVADIYDIKEKHTDEVVTFGYVGRLENEKNPFLALDYLHKLNNSNTKLIFFGEGRLLTSLIEYAKQLKLENQVEFRGYTINKSDIYNNIDALINTSKIECSSNSCLEALMCGLQVVSTRTFSYYELKQYFFRNIIGMDSEIKEFRVNSSTIDFKYKGISQLKMESFIDEYLN